MLIAKSSINKSPITIYFILHLITATSTHRILRKKVIGLSSEDQKNIKLSSHTEPQNNTQPYNLESSEMSLLDDEIYLQKKRQVNVTNINLKSNSRRVLDLAYGIERIVPNTSFLPDCLHDTRNYTDLMRPYPFGCYGRKKIQNWEAIFLYWWYYYAPDISYTFDFILWKLNAQKKEESFWYLTLYLKTLVAFIDNPFNMLTFSKNRKAEVERNVDALLKKFHMYENKVVETEYQTNKLVEYVSRFHADKIVLINDINELATQLAHFETDKDLIEKQIKDIGKQTASIRYMLNHFSKEAISKFYAKLQEQSALGFPGYPPFLNPNIVQKIKHVNFPTNTMNTKYDGLKASIGGDLGLGAIDEMKNVFTGEA